VSAVSEPSRLDETTTFYAHVSGLFERYPVGPFPDDGKPYPDHARYRSRRRDRKAAGFEGSRNSHHYRAALAAGTLAEYFNQLAKDAHPEQWYDRFVSANAPIHQRPEFTEVVATMDPVRVRALGRWLVLHSTDTEAAVLGLALLTEAGTVQDVGLIQRIGLLSDTFGPLAAHALERLPGPVENLIWLAERSAGWGRVYVVEALCRLADPASFPWLLRHAVDGDFLNAYYASKVAATAPVHQAIADPSADEEVVDHTGRMLHVLTYAGGMGGTLATYPHAKEVLRRYVRHAARLEPNVQRYVTARVLIENLTAGSGSRLDWKPGELEGIRATLHSSLSRPGWTAAVQHALDAGEAKDRHAAVWAAARLGITARPGARSEGETHE